MRRLNKHMYDVLEYSLEWKGKPTMVSCKHDETRGKADGNWATSIYNTTQEGVDHYERKNSFYV